LAAKKAEQKIMSKKRKPTKITRRRMAGRRHAVVTVEGGGGRGYRVKPCAQCPWRLDQVGTFPAEAFRLSAPTAYDAAMSTFGCHMSPTSAPQTCAGFLLSAGALHNILVRLRLSDDRLDLAKIKRAGLRLFKSYRAMAIANGVAPDDPVLALCRDK
jgi:hypothetical protein